MRFAAKNRESCRVDRRPIAETDRTDRRLCRPSSRQGFLSALDGRTDLAKALRANYDELIADIGGIDDAGHVKRALAERFVWLEAILQTIEHELVQGQIDKSEALGKWIQAVNSLSGLAKVLGVDRKLSQRPWIAPAEVSA